MGARHFSPPSRGSGREVKPLFNHASLRAKGILGAQGVAPHRFHPAPCIKPTGERLPVATPDPVDVSLVPAIFSLFSFPQSAEGGRCEAGPSLNWLRKLMENEPREPAHISFHFYSAFFPLRLTKTIVVQRTRNNYYTPKKKQQKNYTLTKKREI